MRSFHKLVSFVGLMAPSLCGLAGCGAPVEESGVEAVDSSAEELFLVGQRWPANASGTRQIEVCFNAASLARSDIATVRNNIRNALNVSWAAAADITYWNFYGCGTSSNGKLEVNVINAPADGSASGNSDIGYQGSGRPTRINQITANAPQGLIIHEFGHALGFRHEMSRPDFVDEVAPSQCRESNGSGNTLGTPPDKLSIMAGWPYCGNFPNNLSAFDIQGVQNVAGYGVSKQSVGFVRSQNITGSAPAVAANSYNSTGAINTITNLGTGLYRVDFPGLGGVVGGNVQVTAFGGANARCNVAGWRSNLMTLEVTVACQDAAGNSLNNMFAASYHRRLGTTADQAGYVWASQPTTPSYPASSTYSWNSTGGVNTISRSGVGNYTVTLPGVTTTSGTTQVTAYGGNHYCKVQSWFPNGNAQLVNVACFSPQGLPRDGLFTMAFSRFSPNLTPAFEYAWVNDPTSFNSTPHGGYQNGGIPGDLGASDVPPLNPITVSHYTVGGYNVRFPNMIVNQSKSNVKVTAYGSGNETCKVGAWATELANVLCTTPQGAPVNTRFAITFSSDLILIR